MTSNARRGVWGICALIPSPGSGPRRLSGTRCGLTNQKRARAVPRRKGLGAEYAVDASVWGAATAGVGFALGVEGWGAGTGLSCLALRLLNLDGCLGVVFMCGIKSLRQDGTGLCVH